MMLTFVRNRVLRVATVIVSGMLDFCCASTKNKFSLVIHVGEQVLSQLTMCCQLQQPANTFRIYHAEVAWLVKNISLQKEITACLKQRQLP